MASSELAPEQTRARLLAAYRRVRATTERLAAPLSPEDQALQSMEACSPTKWHRAHTTWFFETFVLAPRGVPPFDERWGYLFNSYYVTVGPRHPRPRRGMLSRPSTDEIARYRAIVDERVLALLARADDAELDALAPLVDLGLAHEQQHQELLLTDVLHALAQNPLRPAYRGRATAPASSRASSPLRFVPFDGGLFEIGAAPGATFRFDNEEPRHRVYLAPFAIADRLVTVGEWKAFAGAGGYEDPSLWLSEGFDWARAHDVRAPLHAWREGEALMVFGLDGAREADDDEPITHLGYYEADALARFLGARLPTEAEWEHAAARTTTDGNFLDALDARDTLEEDALRALPAPRGDGVRQLFGDAWEWTSSSYAPYPGYRAAAGALGEYNGKFMVNQLVLRGGSCFTPRGHVRASYRNFWHPDTRFQVTGVRLARTTTG